MDTPDEIWAGDLLGRRSESEDLIGYLESVAARPQIREEGHAHVLAVDAKYGEGKTYFLRRFARHMAATEHPVAFVDAWVDDLEDEPLVALAATLEEALSPYVQKHPSVRDKVSAFTRTAGRVGAIVATGLAKRGLGLLITQGAVAELDDAIQHGSDLAKDVNQDAIKKMGEAVLDDTTKALAEVATPSMEARIARFREGRAAVTQMKTSLAAVVDSLAELGIKTPVTIVIDELDRCRPTYAIKLLEEVKHLFDVPGVAFVLGLHGEQLTHSIAATYGERFEAHSYLRRFFSRSYSLAPVSLDKLVEMLIGALKIPQDRLLYPLIVKSGHSRAERISTATFISDVMKSYELSARDSFSVMESIQTALALTAPKPLNLAYLLPMIAWQTRQLGWLAQPGRLPWSLAFNVDSWNSKVDEVPLRQYLGDVSAATEMDRNELMRAANDGSAWGVQAAWENWIDNQNTQSLALLDRYPEFLRIVRRFSSDDTTDPKST